MTADELVPRLKRLLVESLHLDGLSPEAITDDEPLFGARLGLDSVDALELVVALEREFGVAIPSDEIGGEAFASVRALAGWLAPRLGSGAPAATGR
ncbi:MAG TPA: phosphopantetheine-binding protein [Solirubrobacteraceae bacterium]|jgi:acyl carrier protein|nr:phosphopantetheine-binding protein [Solirubrobacteraceae bacterium]